MDFSSIKKVVIPEGEAKQISKNGQVFWKKREIPSEYQQLESISCNGTNYIDLGYKHNNATLIKMSIKIPSTYTGWFPFGARDWNAHNSLALFHSNVGKLTLMLESITIPNPTPSLVIDENEVLDIEFDNSHFKVNEEEITFTTTISSPTVNDLLFAMQDMTGVPNIMDSMTVYSFQIYEYGNIVKDLKPVKRISDGVEGLYDIENEEFLPFTVAGGGINH